MAPSRRRHRVFRPVLDGLEDRQLLSALYLRGSYSGNAMEFQSPPTGSTVNLGTIADITWLSPADNIGDTLTATVNWGDGTPTETYNAGKFLYPSGFNGIIVPQHTFQQAGNLKAQITVTDQHGGICKWSDPFTVADPGYTINQEELTPVGKASNVVGAVCPIKDTLFNPNPDVTATIQILSCTYTAYDSQGRLANAFMTPTQTDVVTARGYHVNRTSSVSAANLVGNTAWTSGTYWGSLPGTFTIKSDIRWVDSNGLHRAYNEVASPETVTQPAAVMTPIMNSGEGAIYLEPLGNGDYRLQTDGPDISPSPAIVLDVTIDPTQHGTSGGIFGVVQTLSRSLYRWAPNPTGGNTKLQAYTTNSNGVYVGASTLLDNTPPDELANGEFTPYYGTPYGSPDDPSQTTWKVGETLEVIDVPTADFPAGTQGDFAMSDSSKFMDTVMFTPSGGIPVPIASMQWGYSANVVMGETWPEIQNGPTDPYVISSPKPTYTFPAWGDIVPNYSGQQTVVAWTDPPKPNPA